jgi:hypothetical protein
MLERLKAKLRRTHKLARTKEEVELVLRALVGGGALTFLFSELIWDKIAGLALALAGLLGKEWNYSRKDEDEL